MPWPKKRRRKPIAPKALAKIVCEKTEAPIDVVWPIIQEFLETMSEELMEGRDVWMKSIGTFRWYILPPMVMYCNPTTRGPVRLGWRRKLKYESSGPFVMTYPIEEEDVEKYGVKFSRFKKKFAEEVRKNPDDCPICGEKIDEGGACPKHGTKPFEDEEGEDE